MRRYAIENAMSDDAVRALQAELATYQRRLAVLQTQIAQFGSAHAPADKILERDEARAEIARLAAELRARGVPVDGPPGAEPAAAAAPAPAPAPQIGQAEIASIINLPGANFAGAQGISITGVQVGARTPPAPPPPDTPEE